MSYGQKMGSLKGLKQSLQKGGSSNAAWIKFIPKNGSMNVRFIEEPEEWVNYTEHWDGALRKSFPCNGEASCPGCMTGERKTNRYLANAVDVDTDRVIPLQMPKDLANRLVARYERNGTLTDRDFELSRSGEGLDTVYDLDAQAIDRKNISKYQPLDLLKVLDDAFNDVFGSNSVVPEVTLPKSQVKVRGKSAAAKIAQGEAPDVDTTLEDEDEDVPEVVPAKKAAKKAAAKKAKPEPEFTPEVDEGDEDEYVGNLADSTPPAEDESDDEQEWDEASLKALPLGALRAVARDFGVDVKGKDSDTIVKEIMAAGEAVDDDEPPY